MVIRKRAAERRHLVRDDRRASDGIVGIVRLERVHDGRIPRLLGATGSKLSEQRQPHATEDLFSDVGAINHELHRLPNLGDA